MGLLIFRDAKFNPGGLQDVGHESSIFKHVQKPEALKYVHVSEQKFPDRFDTLMYSYFRS